MGQVITNESKWDSVVKLHEQLKTSRSVWEGHWDEIAKFVIPRKDQVYGGEVSGEKRGNTLFDTEAISANDDLASALHGMLTNPSIIWFGLSTGEPELDADEEVAKWLFESTLATIKVMNQSNFQTEVHEAYLDLGSIGTTSLRIEEDEDDVVRYYCEPVYEVVLRENNKGRIDFVSREYDFDGRQIIQEFGDEMAPDVLKYIQDKMKANPSHKFCIIHQVSRRSKAEMEGQIGSKAFPISSVHVMKEGAKLLRESGFEMWPYATPRWSKLNSETYGRSPAMKALADIKLANSTKKVTIQGAQLAIAPPLQVPDNGFMSPLQVKPFGVNYYRSGSKDRIETLFNSGNVQMGEWLLNLVHASIKKHFMTDKLITPQLDRMTATETLQRRDEQLRFLGPQLGRMDTEFLKPIIDRTVYICGKKGKYKQMPEKLVEYVTQKGDMDLAIEYRSTIAQAQLITQSENIVRAINSTAFVVGSQPEVMDNIDGDKLLKKNFKTYNVDPGILRSESEVGKIRQQRQEAQQAQQDRENGVQEADAIQKLGAASESEANAGQNQ